MIYLQLFYEYFKAGLFAIGGGLATIPFLESIASKTGWYTTEELANMVAVAESTPGPIGVNVATFVGYKVGGIFGSLVASFGLVLPSFLIIYIISSFLDKYRNNRWVNAGLCGIRPASAALILSALWTLMSIVLPFGNEVNIIPIIIMVLAVVCATLVPKIKDIHPVLFIIICAFLGIVLKL